MRWIVLVALVLARPTVVDAADSFLPHAVCYLWDRGLLTVHAVTDILIGLSYVAISTTLGVLVMQARRDIPFTWIFVAFGAFIVACGATHLMEVWTLWTPAYWTAGGVKVVTALASVATALVLPPLVPKALVRHLIELHGGEARAESPGAGLGTTITVSARAALTAYGRGEDRVRALSAGYDLHITKPVDPDALAVIVGRLAEDRSRS